MLLSVEAINRRDFILPDRAIAQDRAIASASSRSEAHRAEYTAIPESLQGRYVSADLYKETFESFRASLEARNRYNAPIHNSATVLASEHLRRLLTEPVQPDADRVALVTGIPGAGKTRIVMADGVMPPGLAALYEGQLANPATAMQKVDQVLHSGRVPVILAAHPNLEEAMRNTLNRFAHEGRGAGIAVMVDIASKLPDSLEVVHRMRGERVGLVVNDLRDRPNPHKLAGWEHLNTLRSDGSSDQIENRLRAELERQRVAGSISVEAFRQAHGAGPLGPYLGLDRPGERLAGANAERSGLSPVVRGADRAAAFAHARPGAAVAAYPELGASYQAVAIVDAVAAQQGASLNARHALVASAQERIHAELSRGIVHDIKRDPSRGMGR
jgi:hypothetical protein